MSDELAIQPQVIQPKKDRSLTYGTVGALAGAGAGYYVGKNVGNPASFEDIVADATSKDKAEFSSKYSKAEEATVDNILNKAKEVKDAEAALAEAQKPVADANNPDVKAYNDAVTKKDEAYNRFLSEEKARLEKSGSASLKSTDIKPFEPNTNSQHAAEFWPRTSVTGKNKGKALNGEQAVRDKWNELTDNLRQAEQTLETKVNNKYGSSLSTDLQTIRAYMDGEASTYSNRPAEELADIFATKTKRGWISPVGNGGRIWGDKPTEQYQRALDIAQQKYPQFTENNITPEQYLEFGTKVDSYAEVKNRPYQLVYEIDPKTHRPSSKATIVVYDVKDAIKFAETKEAELAAKRSAYADEIFGSAHQRILKNRELAAFDTTFPNSVEKGLAKQTGLYTEATNTFDFGIIQREIGQDFKGYDEDIQALKKAGKSNARQNNATFTVRQNAQGRLEIVKTVTNGNQTNQSIFRTLDHQYVRVGNGNIPTVEELRTMATNRKAVGLQYRDGRKALTDNIEQLLHENQVIKDTEAKMAEMREADKGVQNAINAIREQFPHQFGDIGTPKSTEEIDRLAKEFAEKEIAKGDYQKTIDGLKAAYDKAMADGKVNEEAVNAAKEKVNGAKSELEKLAKDAAEKLGSGKNKWIGLGIGAAALAIAGYIAGKPSDNA